MSIQLADLQSQTTYHVLVKNLETQFIHELSIIQHLGCKVWYLNGGYKSTFCRLKGNLIEYGTIHVGGFVGLFRV